MKLFLGRQLLTLQSVCSIRCSAISFASIEVRIKVRTYELRISSEKLRNSHVRKKFVLRCRQKDAASPRGAAHDIYPHRAAYCLGGVFIFSLCDL